MKTVPLADVLWRAANEHLRFDCGGEMYSCDAVHYCFDEPSHRVEAKQHLKAMGCPTAAYDAFDAFPFGPERQGVRYMWLLLAMHVAEDENIMVEVA